VVAVSENGQPVTLPPVPFSPYSSERPVEDRATGTQRQSQGAG